MYIYTLRHKILGTRLPATFRPLLQPGSEYERKNATIKKLGYSFYLTEDVFAMNKIIIRTFALKVSSSAVIFNYFNIFWDTEAARALVVLDALPAHKSFKHSEEIIRCYMPRRLGP